MEGLWLVAVAGGPIILALALAYGVSQWRRRRVRVGPGDPRMEVRIGEPPSEDRYKSHS